MNGPSCLSFCVAALLPATLLQSCQSSGQPGGRANIIQNIEIDPNFLLSAGAPSLGTPIPFIIRGVGGCPVDIKWGDGSTDQEFLDLSGGADTVRHTFNGWSGGKTVSVVGRAIGSTDCLGGDTVRFNIPPTVLNFPIDGQNNNATQACNEALPSRGNVEPGWLFQIRNVLIPASPGGINFGCPTRQCVFDAHGSDEAPADASFPFDGFRRYSLVLRINSNPPQIVQGDSFVRFTTTKSGRLEFCLNDFNMANNRGGYLLQVQVDQLGR